MHKYWGYTQTILPITRAHVPVASLTIALEARAPLHADVQGNHA